MRPGTAVIVGWVLIGIGIAWLFLGSGGLAEAVAAYLDR